MQMAHYKLTIIIMTHEEEDAGCLIQAFEDISVLKFTQEFDNY